jgi:hypothetical protein
MMRYPSARKSICGLVVVMLFCLPAICGAQTIQIDKAKTLVLARERYYNLKKLGLSEVKAAIQPNWDLLLEGINVAPGTMTTLNNLHFWISIDSADQLRLSHDGKGIPSNQVEGVEKIFRGMNASMTGFLSTWSIFLLTSPFPAPESVYTIEQRSNGFRFSQRQGELDVTIDTDHEFAITEIRAVAIDRTHSLKPVFEKTPAGLVLTGYAASSQRSDGGGNTTVQAWLEYETVGGLQLLHKVKLDTVFQGLPAKFEWAFADYQVKMR